MLNIDLRTKLAAFQKHTFPLFDDTIPHIPQRTVWLLTVMTILLVIFNLATLMFMGSLGYPIRTVIALIGMGIIIGAGIYLLRRSRYYNLQLKEQSRALIENEERYRSLIKLSFEALLLHDEGVVVDGNETLERMFGYTLSEAIGRSVLDFAAPESRRDLINRQRLSIGEGTFESTARRKDGSTFPVEILERTAIYRGRPVQAVVMRDITDRKRLENQKIELAVERQRVNVLQRFISDASHDFRTPLTTMKTSLYLIKNIKDNPEKQARYIQTLEQQTSRLEKLLDDLLIMSRLERAADEFLLDPIEPNSLLREISAIFQSRYQNRAQTLVMALDETVPPIWADKTMLAQALNRLLENAFNYTPEEGKVTLRTSISGACVRLEVEDTGMGIDAENLPYIFDSFYRADTARGVNGGGTGLGLAIARKIIEAHDGSIEVKSMLGKGTSVSVLLPYVTAQLSTQSQPAPQSAVAQPVL